MNKLCEMYKNTNRKDFGLKNTAKGKTFPICKYKQKIIWKNNNTNVPKGQKVLCNKTAQQLAEKYKVNEKTIRRDAEFVNNNPKEAEEVLQGKNLKLSGTLKFKSPFFITINGKY